MAGRWRSGRFRYTPTTTWALLLRFYFVIAVSDAIRVILPKISNRSEIAVQWNGGFSEIK